MREVFIAKQDVVGIIEKEMKHYVSDVWYKSATHSALNDVNEYIKALEPADVAPVRHARWERYSGITIRCSRCEHVIHDWRLSECKYCPNCGAKMDGEE